MPTDERDLPLDGLSLGRRGPGRPFHRSNLKRRYRCKPRNVALVAHDNRKLDLVGWVSTTAIVAQHELVCTGDRPPGIGDDRRRSTGQRRGSGVEHHPAQIRPARRRPAARRDDSGGPDRRNLLLGRCRPSRDVDVKALLRIAVVYNIDGLQPLHRRLHDLQPAFERAYDPIVRTIAPIQEGRLRTPQSRSGPAGAGGARRDRGARTRLRPRSVSRP